MYRSAERAPGQRSEFKIVGVASRELLVVPTFVVAFSGAVFFVVYYLAIHDGKVALSDTVLLVWLAGVAVVTVAVLRFQYFGRVFIDDDGVTIKRWRQLARICFIDMAGVEVTKHSTRNGTNWAVRIRGNDRYFEFVPDPAGGSDDQAAERVRDAIREAYVAARGIDPWASEKDAERLKGARRYFEENGVVNHVVMGENVIGSKCPRCEKRFATLVGLKQCLACLKICHEDCLADHHAQKHPGTPRGEAQ